MSPLDISKHRTLDPVVVCLGSHKGIIQSILDFDFLCGRSEPTVKYIIATGRKSERYFFGTSEVLIPVKVAMQDVPEADKHQVTHAMYLSSGRRAFVTVSEAIEVFPHLIGCNVFAERVPERHALELAQKAKDSGTWVLGGASVGLMVPAHMKLGAIGGTEATQLEKSRLLEEGGQMAVVSTSGGMVNEIIRTVATSGYGVSFALALGGERFPMLSPEAALLSAEADPKTKSIAYFGELGGVDEYRIAELISQKKITKPIIAYIAGSVSDLFEQPPQFGHAKAMASSKKETAEAKSAALREVGVYVGKTYGDFVAHINDQKGLKKLSESTRESVQLKDRKQRLFTNSLSYDKDEKVYILGHELLDFASNSSFGQMVACMFLGKKEVSKDTEAFVNFVIKLLVDHGPYVSGAVNTMVTARAGKDLVSSLAAGLLTIGPRFGGAINEAAATWLKGVESGKEPAVVVEEYAAQRKYLLGIGHRKYSVDYPDPRVAAILDYTKQLKHHPYSDFALAVQDITTQKKGNLILNVDGAIAAVLLDILAEKEGYTASELQEVVDAEVFNGLFVLSRSVGFMAHYFDQRRLDEGLFRLSPSDITAIE
jgi:ATP citrate (pro-S)-lyase